MHLPADLNGLPFPDSPHTMSTADCRTKGGGGGVMGSMGGGGGGGRLEGGSPL